MEGLVNYSSEDEQDDPSQKTAADRGGSTSSDGSSASPGRSNGKSAVVRGRGSGRSSGATLDGGGGGTSTARNGTSSGGGGNYKGDEELQRYKAPAHSSGGRSGSSAYHGRDNRDVRENKYSKDSRYDHKGNERNRSKDYKNDHKRERDGYHDGRRMQREDERNRFSSSSSFHRFSGGSGTRDERSRFSSGSNDTFSSSSSATHRRNTTPHQYQSHHQYRAHDDRAEQRSATDYYGRTERTSGSRHRRRSESRTPSPTQHHHSKRTLRPDRPRHHSRHRGRNSRSPHSRSRSPVSRSPSRERVGGATLSQQQPLEQARLSALEMERKIQHSDAASNYKSPQPHETSTPPASTARSNEALLALPLSDTAPKQPNVIAVATAACVANNAEPAIIQLPSYYNPSVINPNKYAEQVQKRKLLWGAKKAEDTAAKWGNAQFSQDSDGKVASKFMRLMGIKGAPQPKSEEGAKPPPVVAAPDVKSREVMFSNMEQQYEVARQATHTMRGVGLGFSSQSRPF